MFIRSTLLLVIASTKLFATPGAPIQRIDLANILSNAGGITETSVLASFTENNATTPCYQTTLAFNQVMTVWVGANQSCTMPITSLSITPVADANGNAPVYLAPDVYPIASTYFSTQITISQNTAPTFDPSNGSVLSFGTVNLSAVVNLG